MPPAVTSYSLAALPAHMNDRPKINLTQEKIVFEIQIPKALQLYKALSDGAGPASHEAFMSEIIQANRIPLPELPEGQIYRYDPATEQVMVVPSP